MSINPGNLVVPAIVSLAAWRIYSRTRRTIGRQPLQPKRMMARVIIFSALTLLIALALVLFPRLLIGYGGGLALGGVLGLFGLRLTRFETTPEGLFYTPNTYIGVALSVLLVARLAYRLMVLQSISPPLNPHQPPAFQSPLTLFMFGLLAGYNITYYAGVLWRSHPPKINADQ